MNLRFVSMVFIGLLYNVKSFTPTSILSGPVGPNISIFAVPKNIAFQYLKKTQLEQIRKDAPIHILQELNDAREMARRKNSNSHYSFLVPDNSRDNLFTIIYRMSNKFPIVYTIEAVIRDPSSKENISILELENILNQMIVDRKGYLQIHDLGTWASGRYKKELLIERQFHQ